MAKKKYSETLKIFLFLFLIFRPPGIYKQDYLQELYKRYDDAEFTPAAPARPDWCNGKYIIFVVQFHFLVTSLDVNEAIIHPLGVAKLTQTIRFSLTNYVFTILI